MTGGRMRGEESGWHPRRSIKLVRLSGSKAMRLVFITVPPPPTAGARRGPGDYRPLSRCNLQVHAVVLEITVPCRDVVQRNAPIDLEPAPTHDVPDDAQAE